MHVGPRVTDTDFGPISDPQTSARMTLSSLVTCLMLYFELDYCFFLHIALRYGQHCRN